MNLLRQFWLLAALNIAFMAGIASAAVLREDAGDFWRLDVGYEAALPRWQPEEQLSRPFAHLILTESPMDTVKTPFFPEVLRAEGQLRWELKDPGLPQRSGNPSQQILGRVDELTVRFRGRFWRLTAGLQEVVWGETFGMPIIDIVNARDLRESPFADPACTHVAEGMINGQLFWRQSSLQMLVTPLPPRAKLPPTFAGQPLIDASDQGGAPEIGLRFGQLFASGLDAKVFALRHQSRIPAYTMIVSPSGPTLAYYAHPVTSIGASYSYAGETWVWRGDAIHTWHQPAALGGEALDADVNQGVLGVDYSPDTTWSLGFQLQSEAWSQRRPGVVGNATSHWLGALLKRQVWSDKIAGSILIFKGLDNKDIWIKPQVTMRPSPAWTISLAYDHVDGAAGETGYFGPWRDADRLSTKLDYSF